MTSADDLLAGALADQRADHLTYVADAVGDFAVSRADLFYVFDARGNKFLDLSGGDGVMVTGHTNVPMLGGIHDQLANYEHTARSGEHVAHFVSAYAKAISATFPEVDNTPQKVLFCPSDLEARSHAMAMAQVFTDRVRLVSAATLLADYDVVWNDVAAVVMELVSADMIPVDMTWARVLCEKAEAAGTAVVLDETRTGYGRTGSLWAHQQWGIDPTITVLGGAGGGGLPFGAVVAPKRVFDSYLIPRRQFGASAAICRAGTVILDQLSPALLEHVTEVGYVFDDAVVSLHNQFPEIVEGSHGIGLAKALVLTTEQNARRFFIEAVTHGLLIRPPTGRIVTVTPSLMISEEELRRAVDLMADACLDWTDPL